MIKKLLVRLLRWLTKTPEPLRDYIREVRWKVLYNPFQEKHMWCMLNPRTHVWDWQYEASPAEVAAWGAMDEDTQRDGISSYDFADVMYDVKNEEEREETDDRTNGNSRTL